MDGAIADGLSNRDAAQALSLTERTVEAQLTSICRKLGPRARVQLVRWLLDRHEPRGK